MNAHRRAIVALAAWCSLARAAPRPNAGPRKIGILFAGSSQAMTDLVPAVYAALHPLGFVEGRDVTIVWRASNEDDRRLPALARELVAEGIDLLMTDGSPATHAARAATATIPIVTSVGDPQRSGFAASIVRPGGNITGLTSAAYDVSRRQVDLLRAFLPRMKEVFVFQRSSASPELAELSALAARDAGLRSRIVTIRAAPDIENALRAMPPNGASGALMPSYLQVVEPAAVIGLALRHKVAVVTNDDDWTVAGALVSFVLFQRDEMAHRASLIAEILRGANPAEIPFQLPDAYHLVINRTTAKKLGLEIPRDLLIRATRIVD